MSKNLDTEAVAEILDTIADQFQTLAETLRASATAASGGNDADSGERQGSSEPDHDPGSGNFARGTGGPSLREPSGAEPDQNARPWTLAFLNALRVCYLHDRSGTEDATTPPPSATVHPS